MPRSFWSAIDWSAIDSQRCPLWEGTITDNHTSSTPVSSSIATLFWSTGMKLILGAARRAVIEKVEEERAVEDLRSKHQCRAACDDKADCAGSGQGSEADIEPVGERSPESDQSKQQHTSP